MGKSNLDLVNDCDSFPYPASATETSLPNNLYVLLSPESPDRPQVPIGFLSEPVFNALAKVPIRLKGEMDVDRNTRTVSVFTQATEAERTAAVKATVDFWREKKTFKILEGWRDELYPCYGPLAIDSKDKAGAKKGEEAGAKDYELLWDVERAASALFGIGTYGIHLTAYVQIDEQRQKEEGTKYDKLIWIPRRSKTKQTYPSMLDNTVAGGMASGEDIMECVIRECEEEASLPASIVREHVISTGAVTYIYVRDSRAGGETGLIQPECEYVFDLPLPASVIPKPNDSEVEEFYLLTVEKCQEYLANGEFKPNCAMLMLDFFVRHGVITVETEGKDVYEEIVRRLHRGLDVPGPWAGKVDGWA